MDALIEGAYQIRGLLPEHIIRISDDAEGETAQIALLIAAGYRYDADVHLQFLDIAAECLSWSTVGN